MIFSVSLFPWLQVAFFFFLKRSVFVHFFNMAKWEELFHGVQAKLSYKQPAGSEPESMQECLVLPQHQVCTVRSLEEGSCHSQFCMIQTIWRHSCTHKLKLFLLYFPWFVLLSAPPCSQWSIFPSLPGYVWLMHLGSVRVCLGKVCY